MTDMDQADVRRQQRVENRHDVVAGQREHVCDAELLQRPGDGVGAPLHAFSRALFVVDGPSKNRGTAGGWGKQVLCLIQEPRQAMCSSRISAMLIAISTMSETTTASVTRPPTRPTTRTSTPSPSAAIDTTVRSLAAKVMGISHDAGIRPLLRAAASTRKPMMNHGTRYISPGRHAAPATLSRARNSDSSTTTGPSISTRTSFTSVPSCALTALIGTVAASTCGTA